MENEAIQLLDLCLKCGSRITHVPYRFEGKVFHARCLLCNACGKRLVGKPFITKNRQIFCGEQCKSHFEQGIKPRHLKDPHESPADSLSDADQSISLDESLTEALEQLQDESNPRLVKGSDHPPLERLTDYPVGEFLGSAQAQSFEADSISTFSESSFTSDSSLAYDASRKPRKKILKTSHGLPGRNSNKLRVRWKLNDQDNISMASVSSVKSDSGLLHSHMEAARRTLQNWRDFEAPLPPGSTGLTPTKPKYLSKSTNFLNPGPFHGSRHPSSPPNGIRPPGPGQGHSEHRPPLPPSQHSGNRSPSHGYKPHQLVARHDSAPARTSSSSDLFGRLGTSSPQKEDGGPYRLRHARLSPQKQWKEEDSANSSSCVLDVSVFHLDEKNLPQLEGSTLEDRKVSNLFEFPRRTSPFSRTSPTRKASTSSDDANDYDHLLEMEAVRKRGNQRRQQRSCRDIVHPRALQAKDRLAPQAPDERWYTKEDIEEALRDLKEEEENTNQEESSKNSPSQSGKSGSPRASNGGSRQSAPSRTQAPLSDEGEDYDHLNAPPPLPPKKKSHRPKLPSPSESSSSSSTPPPLPPKKRHSSSGSDNPQSPLLDKEASKARFQLDFPAATSTPNHTLPTKGAAVVDRIYHKEESIILPPPSEFAGSPPAAGTEMAGRGKDLFPSPQLKQPLVHSASSDTLTGSDSPSQAHGEHPVPTKEADIYPEAVVAGRPSLSWSSPPPPEPTCQISDRVVEGAEDPVRNPSPFKNLVAAGGDESVSKQQWQPHSADYRHGGTSSPSPQPPPRSSSRKGSAVSKELGKMGDSPTHPDHHHHHHHRHQEQQHHSADCYHLPVDASNPLQNTTTAAAPLTETSPSPPSQELSQPFSKWFQNNSKPSNKKPAAAEMDTDLCKLLDDLDIDTIVEEASSQHHSGVCCVCHTIIPSSRFLLRHAGKIYHIGCFSCVQCGCPLKGQKIFTLQNGSVLCEEHYRRLLLTQQQQTAVTAFRRGQQPLPYQTTSQNNFSSHHHQPAATFPYKRLPGQPSTSSSYTMV